MGYHVCALALCRRRLSGTVDHAGMSHKDVQVVLVEAHIFQYPTTFSVSSLAVWVLS